MNYEESQELRRLEEKLNGVIIAVESGVQGLRKDVGYLGRLYVPLTALTVLAVILAVLALGITLENRALLMQQMLTPPPVVTPAVPER